MATDNPENQPQKEQFIYPFAQYQGKYTPENLVFNANLQEFAQRTIYLCNLETNGKIDSLKAYNEIKALWCQLHKSYEEIPPEDA